MQHSSLRAKRSFDLAFNASGGSTASVQVYSKGTLTFSGLPTADDTITVNGVVFTFKAAAATATQITIGDDAAETAANAVAVLNASTNANVAKATYSSDGDTLTITHDTIGPEGDTFTLAEAATNVAASGASLTNGNGFQPHERTVRLVSTTACRVTIGGASSIYLPANMPEVFFLAGVTTLSAISNSATTGTLNISVMTP